MKIPSTITNIERKETSLFKNFSEVPVGTAFLSLGYNTCPCIKTSRYWAIVYRADGEGEGEPFWDTITLTADEIVIPVPCEINITI